MRNIGNAILVKQISGLRSMPFN